jgi:hypothetical protein
MSLEQNNQRTIYPKAASQADKQQRERSRSPVGRIVILTVDIDRDSASIFDPR